MIPVCNRLTYLEQALRSVLDQAPGTGEMQIEVIDNSTREAGVEDFVRRVAESRVSYFRQPVHRTMSENWNTCLERSQGTLVHLLHDDDFVAPGFYREIDTLSNRFPDVALLVSRSFVVDEKGVVTQVTPRLTWLEESSRDATPNYGVNLIQCPGVVMRRDFYELSGGFRTDIAFALDYEMWMRAIIRAGAAALSQPMAYYREHGAADTSERALKGLNVWESWKVGLLIASYSPSLDVEVYRRWCEWNSCYQSSKFETAGNHTAAAANFRVFWKVSSLRGKVRWFFRATFDGAWKVTLKQLRYLVD